jgi:hypothetical protein
MASGGPSGTSFQIVSIEDDASTVGEETSDDAAENAVAERMTQELNKKTVDLQSEIIMVLGFFWDSSLVWYGTYRKNIM